MSDSYDTTELSDKHLTAIERGKIEALQKEEKYKQKSHRFKESNEMPLVFITVTILRKLALSL